MPEPTPSETCYAAWRTHQRSAWLYERPLPWDRLDASTQRCWDAAAQAVLAMQKEEETRGSPGNSPHALS